VEQSLTLFQRFANEPKFEVLEVADAAVHESAGGSGGSGAKILAVDDHGGEPPQLGFTGYGEAVYPATNDENVDRDNIRVAVILTIMQGFTYVIHVP